MSREELIALLAERDARLAARGEQIAAQARRIEELEARLARLEHLRSRNSGNSSMSPSKDDDPGKTPPAVKPKRRGGVTRKRGKQPGAPGAYLAWTENPGERRDRFPEGRCDCGRAGPRINPRRGLVRMHGIRSPAELIEGIVPTLGYPPENSLVVAMVEGGARHCQLEVVWTFC